ncbi:MAG: response regulator [Deltaproteobacteria bacterium]|nr:response regulator [Deltaproteobacteria bacterium]
MLYVDDDQALRRVLPRGLSTWFDVVSVANADAAVDAASGSVFDAALVDLEMPDASGWETIERIGRVDARLARRAIIFTGAQLDEQTLAWSRARGHDIVPKTTRAADLATAVLDRIRDVQ